MWTGENDSNTLRVDPYFFFSKTEKKKFPFSKISGYLWTGPYFLEMLPRGIQEKKTNKQAHKQERSPSYGSKAKLLRLIPRFVKQNISARLLHITYSWHNALYNTS